MAHRQAARPARDGGGAPARHRPGRPRAAGAPQRLRRLRPARRDGPLELPRVAAARARPGRARESSAAAGGFGCAGSLLRRRARVRRRARPRHGRVRAAARRARRAVTAAAPFVKTRTPPLPGEWATEAAGLRWLGEAGVPVPEGLEASEDRLVLERLSGGTTDPEALGRTVARLHRAGAPRFGSLPPGAPGPYRIALVEFPAGESDDWPAFYAERRLLPLAHHARSVAAVCERITDLSGPAEPPARLHGD